MVNKYENTFTKSLVDAMGTALIFSVGYLRMLVDASERVIHSATESGHVLQGWIGPPPYPEALKNKSESR